MGTVDGVAWSCSRPSLSKKEEEGVHGTVGCNFSLDFGVRLNCSVLL